MNTSELEKQVYDLLGSVIDPELGRSVTELNMVTGVHVIKKAETIDTTKFAYDVEINLELTVPNCPLAEVITGRVQEAISKYPQATGFVPLKANAVDMTVLINKDKGEVVKIVDLRPWK